MDVKGFVPSWRVLDGAPRELMTRRGQVSAFIIGAAVGVVAGRAQPVCLVLRPLLVVGLRFGAAVSVTFAPGTLGTF
jgi:hypothetical protein